MSTLEDLKRLGKKYQKAKSQAAQYQEELTMLVWQAQEEGIGISEIARVTGLSRPNVHYLITKVSGQYGPTRNDRIREWLRERGYEVSDIGEVPKSLVQDYENAHKKEGDHA